MRDAQTNTNDSVRRGRENTTKRMDNKEREGDRGLKHYVPFRIEKPPKPPNWEEHKEFVLEGFEGLIIILQSSPPSPKLANKRKVIQ